MQRAYSKGLSAGAESGYGRVSTSNDIGYGAAENGESTGEKRRTNAAVYVYVQAHV